MSHRLHSFLRNIFCALSFCFLLFCSWLAFGIGHSAQYNEQRPFSGIKLIWAWSVGQEFSVDDAVAQAHEMGFNAVGWSNPAVVNACRNRKMKSLALVSPLSLDRKGALPQVLVEGEEALPGFDRSVDDPNYPFQYGGEPVPGNREVLHMNLACPRDPGVIAYGVAEALRYHQLGYDGICWDFVGYRNYHSCECRRCRKTLASLQAGGAVTPEAFYLSSLTGLYSRLYYETKKSAPELLIAAHIYPAYLPNIHYGQKISADYYGETVAWFFQPHWSFEKIREYARKTLFPSGEFGQMEAMPMIGFYTDGQFSRDRKSPERLELELRILRLERAKNLMICELGHLLRDPAAMKVVKGSL
jgi:hypothetical protein